MNKSKYEFDPCMDCDGKPGYCSMCSHQYPDIFDVISRYYHIIKFKLFSKHNYE